MVKFPDFFSSPEPRDEREADAASRTQASAGDAQLEMGTALIFGLELRNTRLRFIEHCARVATLVDRLADAFSLPPGERADLYAAAQLHEIGMISVPAELIESPEALDERSLARLRAADALDTMLHPRPYQADLDPALPPQILRGGRGTNFHPQAVESLLQLQGLR